MITNWKEIICDNCGQAEHFRGSIKNCNEQAKDYGWIISDNGKKHFCDNECKIKSKE